MIKFRDLLRVQAGWYLGVSLLLALALAVQVGAVPVHATDWLVVPTLFEWSASADAAQALSPGSHVLVNLR